MQRTPIRSASKRTRKYLKKRYRLFNVARNTVNSCDSLRFSAVRADPELANNMQLVSSGIYVWPKFLSPEECREIVSLSEPKLARSLVAGESEFRVSNHRTSEGYILNPVEAPEISARIRNRLSAISQLPVENQEELKVIRYSVGQEYKIHHDCHLPLDGQQDRVFLKQGGHRIFSCLIYLNDEFSGGNTTFPNIELSVTPEAGTLLIWNNLDGEDIKSELIHKAEPIDSGEKWAMTVWVREAKYRNEL